MWDLSNIKWDVKQQPWGFSWFKSWDSNVSNGWSEDKYGHTEPKWGSKKQEQNLMYLM
jgi:hypothetical protein